MTETISVEPLGDGWSVHMAGLANDQVFRSGVDAEAAARWLAHSLTRSGRSIEVQVRLRNGRLAGRILVDDAPANDLIPASG